VAALAKEEEDNSLRAQAQPYLLGLKLSTPRSSSHKIYFGQLFARGACDQSTILTAGSLIFLVCKLLYRCFLVLFKIFFIKIIYY
jgi:hypothetical protein